VTQIKYLLKIKIVKYFSNNKIHITRVAAYVHDNGGRGGPVKVRYGNSSGLARNNINDNNINIHLYILYYIITIIILITDCEPAN